MLSDSMMVETERRNLEHIATMCRKQLSGFAGELATVTMIKRGVIWGSQTYRALWRGGPKGRIIGDYYDQAVQRWDGVMLQFSAAELLAAVERRLSKLPSATIMEE